MRNNLSPIAYTEHSNRELCGSCILISCYTHAITIYTPMAEVDPESKVDRKWLEITETFFLIL